MAFTLFQSKSLFKFVSKYYRISTFRCRDYSFCFTGLNSVQRQTIFQFPFTSWRLSTHRGDANQPPPPDKKIPGYGKKGSGTKITLIGSANVTSVTTLEEARKISRKHDLKLVKLLDNDAKTQRPVYKLMTGSEFYKEDLKQRELKAAKRLSLTIRGVKLVTLSCRISENDLQSRVKNILKWLAKHHEVRVIINDETSGSNDSSETIYKFIEQGIKGNGRILQKRQGEGNLKFQIVPPKRDSVDNKDNHGGHIENPEVV